MSWYKSSRQKIWSRWFKPRKQKPLSRRARKLELEALETRLMPASLSGYVYVDANDDGIKQSGEVGISGVTLSLTGKTSSYVNVNLTATTSSNGAYTFSSLSASNYAGYTITETQPSGYLDGKEKVGTPGGSASNNVISGIVVSSSTSGTNHNFGELLPSSISGRTLKDLTGNGLSADDAGLGGITVKIYKDLDNDGIFDSSEAAPVATTVSASGTGDYAFTNLPPARYFVQETVPSNYIRTEPPISTYHTVLIGGSGEPAGTDVTGKDFDNYHKADDKNRVTNISYLVNGTTTINDLGSMTNQGDQVQATFTVTPGAPVNVTLVSYTAPGPTFVAEEASQQVIWDVDTASFGPGTHTLLVNNPLSFYQIDLVAGPAIEPFGPAGGNIFFGMQGRLIDHDNDGTIPPYANPGSLAGFVYADLNNNGVKDAGEAALAGVMVTLTGTDSEGHAVSLIRTTRSDGSYKFDYLRPSNGAGYTIRELVQPAGYLDGQDTPGSLGGNASVNEYLSGIVLGAGVHGVNYNFGELLPSSLSGFVYSDVNNDGIKQGSETGIWFATVTLTGTDDRGDAVNQTVLADSSGAYTFTDLRPGTYQIAGTQPGAYLDGKDTIGTPGGTAANDVFSNILLNAGVDGVNNNFGELLPASLAGFVYVDANNNGLKQTGEAGISGVTVTLTGTDDRGDAVTLTGVSDSTGAYAFPSLRPGIYTLTESQPEAYLDGKDTKGTPGGTAGNDLIVYIVLNVGVDGANHNFGELVPSSMAGIVYVDTNNDGIQQASESAISGVTVRLSGSSDRGLVSIFTTTDASGAYLFSDLRPGTYKINETQPDGYIDGEDTIGTPGGIVGKDYFRNIVLASGVDGANNNFGELLASSLTGFVYADTNNDGIKQESEAGLANIWVTMMGTNDLGKYVATSTKTNSSGAYTFSNLRPGTYKLKGSQNWSYYDGKDTAGTLGGTVSNDLISNIVLQAGITGSGYNFGELGRSSLGGFVYKDLNNDGIKQATEPNLGSVLVRLTGTNYLGGAVNRTLYTNSLGAYNFTNLRPGTYTLTETQPAAFVDGKDTIGTPGGNATVNDVFSAIVLNGGVTGANNNFGELSPSSLAGFVYVDINNDGIKQSADQGISNATVTLTGTTDVGTAVDLTATTSSTGAYTFANLRPGTYTLTQTQPADYFDGLDTIGTPGGTTGNDVFSNIVLGAGVVGTNNNFAEVPASTLSGYVYADANDNGWYGWNEMGINGVSVTLTGTDVLGNAVNLTTTTSTLPDAATGLPTRGAYVFDNLPQGTYVLTHTQPEGFFDGKDTVGTSGGTLGTDVISDINLNVGIHGKGYNLGELQPEGSFSSLSGFVYMDVDNDGVKDTGETGIASVLVTLTGIDTLGDVLLRAFTDSSGAYVFPTLLPGTYTLTETQPAAYPDGQDASSIPVGTAANDSVSNIVIDTVTNLGNYNFGEMAPASLGGFVYKDFNNDGLKQDGEGGISDVTVYLTGTDDLGNAVSKNIKTTSSGSYIFTTLRPGTYTLTEVQPAAFFDGLDTIGTPGGTTGDDVFSNIVLNFGVSGQNNNFGELSEGTLTGYVYRDLNNDGTKQAGEAGISGVSVALTGTDSLGNAVSLMTTTGTNGSYTFTNLQPGTYALTETQPAGFMDGLDTAGLLGGTAGDDVISAIVLLPGTSGFNYNFGERPPSSLSGRVFADLNNNSAFDSNDLGISGVVLSLTGTDLLGNPVNLATTTNETGHYSFTNLQPGTYALAETQPVSYLDGKDTAGTLGGTLGNDVFSDIVLPAGIAGVNYNFGELPPASLSGFVYADSNDDGLKQTGETGISGVTVTLTGTDDLGTAINRTTTTDNTGGYAFDSLRPGTYLVAQTQPAGYVDGKDTIGTPGGNATVNDVFSNVQLTAGVQGADNNFGELVPAANASLSGFVYVDVNNDGTKQAGESGISGATLHLTGTDDLGAPVDRTTTTDVTGAYAFDHLRAGTYTLTEDQPASHGDGLDSVGTQGGTASHNDVTNQDVFSIALAPGVQGIANNFGELPLSGTGSLSGYVFEDYNNNGLFETDAVNNEAGIYYATLTLTGTDDQGNAVNLTTTTDLNGYYAFPNLRPGTYTLTETQPDGYLDGMDTLGSDVAGGIVIGAGVDSTGNNFGELPPASISGYVYLESDGLEGFSSSTETGINGVLVTLTGKDDLGQDVFMTATTADVEDEFGNTVHGYFEFPSLRPSDADGYTLTQTQPENYISGPDSPGSAGGNDSIPNVLNYIMLTPGMQATDNAFGELLPEGDASLSGSVYEDTNNDGVQQAGELGISNVLVTLTGTDSAGNAIMITTSTGEDGSFLFENLPAGTYTLTESQPAGYLDGTDTLGGDISSPIVLDAGVQGTGNNFGELLPSTLSGYVYLDGDNDGIFDIEESAIFAGTGVVIFLDGIDDLGNAVHLETTADINGFYIFVNLRPGTYSLHEEQPLDYFDGKETPGSLGGLFAFTEDGDGSFHTDADLIYAIALNTAGMHGDNYNFGELDHAS